MHRWEKKRSCPQKRLAVRSFTRLDSASEEGVSNVVQSAAVLECWIQFRLFCPACKYCLRYATREF